MLEDKLEINEIQKQQLKANTKRQQKGTYIGISECIMLYYSTANPNRINFIYDMIWFDDNKQELFNEMNNQDYHINNASINNGSIQYK